MKRRCLANTLEGIQCKRTAAQGLDFCANHNPRPKKPRAWFITLNLKPLIRRADLELFQQGYKVVVIGKPFEKREHAENWLSNNTDKLWHWPKHGKARFTPDPERRFVSACIQSYPVRSG